MTSESKVIYPDLPSDTPAGQMLWLSLAYAEAAVVLCEAMEKEDFYPQYTATRVVLHLTRHSAELYLKGSISKASGESPATTHRLDELFKAYRALYSSDRHFTVPFSHQALEPDDGLFPGTLDSYLRTHDQRYRYPTDVRGRNFVEMEAYSVESYKRAVKEYFQTLTGLIVALDIRSL